MGITFDPEKEQANAAKHGLSLADFRGFDRTPTVRPDRRRDYGEERYRAWGRIRGQAYCIAYVVRDSDIRVISFRRAHDKEMRRHE